MRWLACMSLIWPISTTKTSMLCITNGLPLLTLKEKISVQLLAILRLASLCKDQVTSRSSWMTKLVQRLQIKILWCQLRSRKSSNNWRSDSSKQTNFLRWIPSLGLLMRTYRPNFKVKRWKPKQWPPKMMLLLLLKSGGSLFSGH